MQDYDTALKMPLNDSRMDGRKTGFTVSIEMLPEPIYEVYVMAEPMLARNYVGTQRMPAAEAGTPWHENGRRGRKP